MTTWSGIPKKDTLDRRQRDRTVCRRPFREDAHGRFQGRLPGSYQVIDVNV